MYLENFYQTENVQEAYINLVFRYLLFSNKPSLKKPTRHDLAWFLVHIETYPDTISEALQSIDSCLKEIDFRFGEIQELMEEEWISLRTIIDKEMKKYNWKIEDKKVSGTFKKIVKQYTGLIYLNIRFPVVRGAVPWEISIYSQFELIQNNRILSENALETELYLTPSLVEEQLLFTKRQEPVRDGQIDLVGKDKEGRVVLCEVKVEEDKDVLWQAIHYPLVYQEKYGYQDGLRMIVIAPRYENTLENCLRKAGAELFLYRQENGIQIIRY